MAKSDKFSSKVPALADYTPSFVNEDGEITDAKAVVKLVHNLMTDKAKAQDAREDALAEAVAVAEERDGLQEKLDELAQAVRKVSAGGTWGGGASADSSTMCGQLEMSTTELQRSYRESHEALMRAMVSSMMQAGGGARRGWEAEEGPGGATMLDIWSGGSVS